MMNRELRLKGIDYKKSVVHLLMVTVVLSIVVICGSMQTNAASGYKKIEETPKKVGNYYYKLKFKNGVYVVKSRKKNSGYKVVLKNAYSPFTNGKHFLDINSVTGKNGNSVDYLVRYNSRGKKMKKLKKLPIGAVDSYTNYWAIGAVKGNAVFLNCSNFGKWKLWVYRYNQKTKTLKKIQNDFNIDEQNGNYVVGRNFFDSAGITPKQQSLFKITSGGKIKKIKTLGKSVEYDFIGKKLYYVKFTYNYQSDWSTISGKVYVSDRSGKNVKSLGAFKNVYYDSGGVLVEKFGKKSLKLCLGDDKYKYKYGDKYLSH